MLTDKLALSGCISKSPSLVIGSSVAVVVEGFVSKLLPIGDGEHP
jgi:hypothetical protein